MAWLSSVVATCAALAIPLAPAEAVERPQVKVPKQDVGIDTLEGRRRAQTQQLASTAVEHGFRFQDRLPESGIAFRHRIVDDAGYHYKPVHYDHGNGIAAADVDGDGRTDLYFTTQLGRNELWRNLGGGRFEDFTEKAGVGLADRISVALVRVHAGSLALTQPSDGKSGYLSQSSLPLYFGLGDAKTVERVEVVWPDGREQVVAGPIAIDDPLEIREPEGRTGEP